ncbi:MAG: hypothetical protein LBH00_09355 [Planctomycetaceae bacterium]|nr:hypothetical protein [Planctomycetaceae bacterium]
MIYCVHQDKGKFHDFKLCRKTILKLLIIGVKFYADSSYQGIQKIHANKMMSYPYRNRRRRHLLRTTLIGGI